MTFDDEAAVRRLAQRLAAAAGRRLDDALPFADAVLPDGTRLHAVLPPLVRSTTISLRVLARRPLDLPALVARGAMPASLAALLEQIVAARLAFVVTGGTGSGKTTLLGALLGTVTATERVLVIEDAPELVIDHPHVVRLVCRGANVEGAGAVGLRELVRQALRMRPDRLVVGEFRGAEMVELLVALNTATRAAARPCTRTPPPTSRPASPRSERWPACPRRRSRAWSPARSTSSCTCAAVATVAGWWPSSRWCGAAATSWPCTPCGRPRPASGPR